MHALNRFILGFSGFSKLEPQKREDFNHLIANAVTVEDKFRVIESTFQQVPLESEERAAIGQLFTSVFGEGGQDDITQIVKNSPLLQNILQGTGRENVEREILSLIQSHAKSESEAEQIRSVLKMDRPTAEQIRTTLKEVSPATMLHLAVILDLKKEIFEPLLSLAADVEWTESMQGEYQSAYAYVVKKKLGLYPSLNSSNLDISSAKLSKLDEDLYMGYVQRLETLTIRGDLSDQVSLLVKLLQRTKTLKELNLRSNSIGDAGAIALAAVLHQMTSLQVLNLSDNNIEQVGLTALAEVLCQMTWLKQLNLGGNYIGRGVRESLTRFKQIVL